MSGEPYWRIVGASWVVFWVYWTMSAIRLRTSRRQAPLAFTVLNMALMYAGFVLVFTSRTVHGALGTRFVPTAVWVAAFGAACVVAGVALAIWARRVLGRNWSGRVRIVEGQRLVRTGPYALARHPIYTGMLLAVLGAALVGGTLGGLLGFGLVLASFWQKARREERFLIEEFGDDYAAYRRAVAFLVPFVW